MAGKVNVHQDKLWSFFHKFLQNIIKPLCHDRLILPLFKEPAKLPRKRGIVLNNHNP